MTHSFLLQQLAARATTAEAITAEIIQHPDMLAQIFGGLKAKPANVKYGCLKVLRLISEAEPALLYPHFDFFIALLDSEVTFFKWGAILIIANLTTVDSEDKFAQIFDRYFAPITAHELIPAANVISSAAKIARAKPELTERITREILQVETAVYQTDECRQVAIGHAIKAFQQFFPAIKNQEPVLAFIHRQRDSHRNGNRKAAEKFVKKYGSDSTTGMISKKSQRGK